MSFRRLKRKTNMSLALEITPLIDVVLLLLIFFMVSTTFVDINAGVNINLPESSLKELPKHREIVVSVDKNKVVYINSQKIGIKKFQDVLHGKLKKMNKENIIIKADKNLPYGFLIKVMTLSRNAGADELDMATEIEK